MANSSPNQSLERAQRVIGLVANPRKPGSAKLVREIIHELSQRGIKPLVEASSAEHSGLPDGLPLDEVADRSDLLIVLGGDGTILWVFKKLGKKIKPIVAINTGTLGFLTCAMDTDFVSVIDAVVDRGYRVSPRAVLMATVETPGFDLPPVYGLNEVSISRAADARVVHIETHIDGEFINHYSGDGLIIATPTGSTAYSLSAGGPILEPTSGVFAITPICPHALANRPLVVGANRVIDLHLPDQRDNLLYSVDGQLISDIEGDFKIRIKRADFDMPLVQFEDASFYDVLHQKLGWFGSTVKKAEGDES